MISRYETTACDSSFKTSGHTMHSVSRDNLKGWTNICRDSHLPGQLTGKQLDSRALRVDQPAAICVMRTLV